MAGSQRFYIKRLIFSTLILTGLAVSLQSQSPVGGEINLYRKVIAIGAGDVTLNSAAGLSPKDTVLLIQMKGSLINVPETGSYGSHQASVGSPGASEFLIISSINVNQVIFTNNIINSYDVAGIVQLVRVPFYNSAIVTSELTCQPWDSVSKTGGVLTMIVGSSLILNNNINVSGKGFIGGTPYKGDGICIETNTSLYDKFSFPDSYLNSGYKGESPAIRAYLGATIFPEFAKGKGANLTGGGGGNGKYSGGGGGSNYGNGGIGGRELNTCTPTPGDGGIGGRKIKSTSLEGGLFLGGGGGSSTYESAPTATPGGRGGGIIIILCDTLKGNGWTIKADGETPGTAATGNAGAGGGGGGGSIALYLQSFSILPSTYPLTISASGGNGGNNAGPLGEGGGGGGGIIKRNNVSIIPSKVKRVVIGGTVGQRSGTETGTAGATGDSLAVFAPILNGFLFNSIRSEVTGNQIDSICSDIPFGLITGTDPVGGSGYSYQWQSSTVSESAGFVPASGINTNKNYSPGILTQTTWFRRIVTSSAPALSDISKTVKIIVQQAITGNIVGKDTIICYNQDPLALEQAAAVTVANGNGIYSYTWLQSLVNVTWNKSMVATGAITNEGYDPPNLLVTTFYKRYISSGRCESFSPTVTITVLPSISGNITARPDSVICEGSLFNNLTASVPGGGETGNYDFQWEESDDKGVSDPWADAFGTSIIDTYTPDTSTFAINENRYYRRVVFSGADSVCQSISVPILLTRYHKIKNNLILGDPKICSGTPPVTLTGSNPLNGAGAGSYTYVWQQSPNGTSSWGPAAGTNNSSTGSYIISGLVDSTWYRRVVNSSKCTNTSPSMVAYKSPTANAGADAVVCGTTVQLNATPSVGEGRWYYPAAVISSTPNAPSVTVNIDGNFSGGNISHKFFWEEVNRLCKNKDSLIITFEKKVSSINAGPDTALYSFDKMIYMIADPVLAWEQGLWSLISGTGDFVNVTDNSTEVRNLSEGINTYLWTVTNGTCKMEDFVNINVYSLIIPEGFSPNNDPGNYNNTFIITGLDLPNQAAELTIVNGAGTEVFKTSNIDGEVWTDWDGKNSNEIDLPEGTYYYLLKLTSNGTGQVFKKSGFIVLKRY